MQRRIIIVVGCLIVLSIAGALVAQQRGAAPAQGQAAPAARGQANTPPEANRPPVFFREEWKHQFDTGGRPEGPLGPEHVSNPNLELKIYGEQPKGDTQAQGEPHNHAGMWMNKRFKEDPAHIFTGTCNSPCGLTFRHKTQYVNLADFGTKIRWQVKQAGYHQVRPLIKLADGTLLVGDRADGWVEGFDWWISEFNISSVRWRHLDGDKVVTLVKPGGSADAKGWVINPDLTRVDEVGLVDLMPGSGHGNNGYSDVGWIEVTGRGVPRTGSN